MHTAADAGPGGSTGSPLPLLARAVTAVRARSVDDLDDAALMAELSAIESATRQLQARAAKDTATLMQRGKRRARDAAEGSKDRAAQKAGRELERRLDDELGWSPGQTKRAAKLGRQLGASDETREAFEDGDLSPRHAATLADTLRFIEDDEARAEAERLLVAAAKEQNATAFGRTCRELLAGLDHAAAMDAERRRRSRRRARTWQTDDGFLALDGRWSGLDGEVVATAIQAFRRMDAPGECRTPEQATADAVVDLAKAALRAGEAPSRHGVRPHVSVTIPWEALLRRAGVAKTRWSGPVPFGEVLRLLADCGVSRLLTDANGVPMEAGEAVRTVPAGLYRALLERDGACAGDGCDVPGEWCEVMHLGTPYRFDGRLTLATSGFGCSYHHPKFDDHGWVATWIDGRPVIHHPDRPPARHGRAGDASSDGGRAGEGRRSRFRFHGEPPGARSRGPTARAP